MSSWFVLTRFAVSRTLGVVGWVQHWCCRRAQLGSERERNTDFTRARSRQQLPDGKSLTNKTRENTTCGPRGLPVRKSYRYADVRGRACS